MRLHQSIAASVVAVLLAACGNGGSQSAVGSIGQSDNTSQGGGLTAAEGSPTVPVKADRDGTVYAKTITSPIGDAVVFQVMEPTKLQVGHTYPLVLQGHGYGGHRNLTPTDFEQRLLDAGYYVISIDQRGFGDSSGTIRVMDPEYEGRDLIAILDWAEDLEGLSRRSTGEMMVGSFGGSYGGMYQVLLRAVDPKHRLRVLAPDITPHDLTYALDPNGVVKSGWGLALSVGGEGLAGPAYDVIAARVPSPPAINPNNPPPHQDAVIYETLIQATLTNAFAKAGINFFKYHSFAYYCDGQPAGPQNFNFATPDQLSVPPTAPPPADVLLTQGVRDTLFNFNDAWHNYQCMKQLGGDVRLFTHQSGHILPIDLPASAKDALDAFYEALTIPGFQASGSKEDDTDVGACGDLKLSDLRFAWFEEKLQGKAGAVDQALGGRARNICMSLGLGDAVEVADATLKAAGQEFKIDGSTSQFNAALGTIVSLQGTGAREALLANQPLMTVADGGLVLAGIPKLHLDIEGVTGAEMASCAAPEATLGCDPILFLAIGHRPKGQTRWDIVDDQITPVRGFGVHDLEMNGISGRFAKDEELALLIYGFHAQFPVTWSRDIFVPAVNLTGTLQLPVRSAGEILRTRIKPPAP